MWPAISSALPFRNPPRRSTWYAPSISRRTRCPSTNRESPFGIASRSGARLAHRFGAPTLAPSGSVFLFAAFAADFSRAVISGVLTIPLADWLSYAFNSSMCAPVAWACRPPGSDPPPEPPNPAPPGVLKYFDLARRSGAGSCSDSMPAISSACETASDSVANVLTLPTDSPVSLSCSTTAYPSGWRYTADVVPSSSLAYICNASGAGWDCGAGVASGSFFPNGAFAGCDAAANSSSVGAASRPPAPLFFGVYGTNAGLGWSLGTLR